MHRDGILETKRLELGHCRANHERKLKELYFATESLVGGFPPRTPAGAADRDGYPEISEEDFLDINDISRERYFDLNILVRVGGKLATIPLPSPSTPSEPATPSPVEDDSLHVDPSPAEAAPAAGVATSQASTPKEEDEFNSTQRSSRSTQAGTPATRDTISGPEEHVVETTVPKASVDDEEDPDDGGDGDVSMVDVGDTDPSTTRSAIGQTSASPLLPAAQDMPEVRIEGAGQTPMSPPLDAEQRSESGLKPGTDAAHQVRVPSSPATPVTPDAQLQLETTQASHQTPEPSQADSRQTVPSSVSSAVAVTEPPSVDQPVVKVESRNLGDSIPESKLAARRRGLSPDLNNTALTKEGSKDLFLSQRPPMRIDTSISQRKNESQAPPTATPATSAQLTAQTSPPERMTTRVSSGVLRHKSVSEILGETPRSAITPHADRAHVERERRHTTNGDEARSQTPRYAAQLATSPESTAFRPRLPELKDKGKDRSKLSTVVFARTPTGGRDGARSAKAEKHRAADRNKDYLITLFQAQASAQVPTLDHLIKSAHKTLSTRDHYVDYGEAQDCRILKRIYHLQNSNRWSLRQLERSVEPERPVSHWDHLLGEAKWLRSDFREERKWRVTVARNLAEWCAEWVNCPVEHRAALQVNVQKPSVALSAPDNHITPVSQVETGCAISDSPPALVPSADDDHSEATDEEFPRLDLQPSIAPAELFSLAPDDVVFELEKTPTSEKILSELPLYQPFDPPRGVKRSYGEMLDLDWKKPIVPISKFATGRLVLPDRKPARKRSRYEYELEDSDDEYSPRRGSAPLPPEQDDVALFNPDNAHIIARLHAAHAFRPPSEFPMPTQAFFEARQPSQWTLAEDDELRRLVREHEYNWSLIAACLAPPTAYPAAAERRTPWECFERWVGFEGLPGDMARHQYFRAWNARRDGARQHLEQAHAAQQQQQQVPGGPVHVRRRSSEPVGVERRRNTKYLALLHAMAKVAKKRETTLQKQQHVASLAAMRKATEPTMPRSRVQSPRAMSALRFKADCERRDLYRQQLAASQRVAMAQKAVQQVTHQQGGVPSMPGSRNGRSSSMGGGQPPMPSLGPNGHPNGPRPLSASQPGMNGLLPNGSALPNGALNMRGGSSMQQAQMAAYLQGQAARLPPAPAGPDSNSARVIMEASRVSEQQRLMQQQRQYGAQPNGLNGAGGGAPTPQQLASMGMNMQANAAMLAASAQQAASGKLSPGAGLGTAGTPSRPSSSPRATPAGPNGHPGQLSSGIVPVLNQISSQLKGQYPQATAEQIKQMATATLNNTLRAQHSQQVAQSMGFGGGGGGGNGVGSPASVAAAMAQGMGTAGGMPQLSPHQQQPQQQQQQQQQHAAIAYGNPMLNPATMQAYAQYMRSQQASQQQSRLGAEGGVNGGGSNGGGGDRGSARPESRGGGLTPQGKSGSVMSGSSQSPHLAQAQMNGSG